VAARGLVAVVQDLHAFHGVNYAPEHEHVRQENLGALRQFAQHSSQLIFSSEYVRQDFLTHFDFDASRAHVVFHGVSEQFHPRTADEQQRFMQAHQLKRPFFLFAGSPRPNKNLPRMLQAWAASRTRASHDVVVMGKVGDNDDGRALLDTIRRLGAQDQVHIIGYVPEQDLATAFSAADGLLFASFDEGFGLPILEAMASGTPVLTSNKTSCPQVAAGHAILAEPGDVDGLRAGVEQLLEFTPGQLENARKYASALNWDRSARGTLDVMRLAARDGR
jgi:glycosyltransferase involved in cell wall biosynthesis